MTTAAIPELKKCSRCRRHLPHDGFHLDKTKHDGRYTICKKCRAGITGAAVMPEGQRQCRLCDEIKPPSEYYPASPGKERHTCKDCCDQRWLKNYRPTPGNRPGHHIQSLWGYLPEREQVTLRRNSPTVRQAAQQADRKYKMSEKGKRQRRKWEEDNRVTLRGYAHKRYARMRELDCGFSDRDWELTLHAFGSRCAYCGHEDIPLTQDHWIPLAHDGPYILGNIVPACKSCNSSKRDRLPSEFCGRELYLGIHNVLCELAEDTHVLQS